MWREGCGRKITVLVLVSAIISYPYSFRLCCTYICSKPCLSISSLLHAATSSGIKCDKRHIMLHSHTHTRSLYTVTMYFLASL